jgi:hypothetical protein
MRKTAPGSVNGSAIVSCRIAPGRFAGKAGAANHELALELRVVVLFRRLLLLPRILRLSPPVFFVRRAVERTEHDFRLRSRVRLWPKLERLLRGFLRRGAKPVPGDRGPGRGRATASRQAAIGQHQGGKQEYGAFRNRRDRLTMRQWKT